MRKFVSVFIVIFLLILIGLGAKDILESNSAVIPIEFSASRDALRMGFATSPVNRLDKIDENNAEVYGVIPVNGIQFKPDAINNVFDTGFFYFYMQIFTQTKIKVTATASALYYSDGTGAGSDPKPIHWENVGMTRQNGIIMTSSEPEVLSETAVLYDESQGSVNTLYPRTANMEFRFQVPFDDDLLGRTGDKYSGTMTITVESAT